MRKNKNPNYRRSRPEYLSGTRNFDEVRTAGSQVINEFSMKSHKKTTINQFKDECGNDLTGCETPTMSSADGCCLEDSFKRISILDKHFPGLRSTISTLTSLIFSRKLESGDGDDSVTDEINSFLDSVNITGQSNRRELTQGIAHALIYGRCGFRWLSEEEGFVFVPTNRYAVIYEESDEHIGVETVKGYVVPKIDSPNIYGETFFLSEEEFVIDFETEIAESENYLFLTRDKFYNFYFDGDSVNADTPLNHDVDRINLFLFLAIQLKETIGDANKDILLVQLAQDLFSMNHSQASDLIATAKQNKDKKKQGVVSEVNTFAGVVANASGRESLVVPPTVESFETINSNIEVTDYLSLYEHMEEFVAGLYGLSSNVLTLSDMPRDASANPIFEQMMKTSIYPKRDIILEFVNGFLGLKLGFDDVAFQEESYALGLRVQNAQSIATVIATIETDERVVPDDIVVDMLYETLRKPSR